MLKQGTQEKEDLELKSVEAHGEWWQGVLINMVSRGREYSMASSGREY